MTSTPDPTTISRYDFDELIDRRGSHSLKWGVGEHELPMWVADMDFRAAPEILAAIREKVDRGVLGYTEPSAAYRDAVADWWRRRHGFAITPEWIHVTAGTVPAISSMVRTLTAPHDRVVLLTPVYSVFFASVRNSGRAVDASRLALVDGAYTIDFDDLAMRLAHPEPTLLVMCNPQNPTGTAWTRDELARIGDLCLAHGVTVISDEVHCDLTRPGVTYTPFASASEVCAALSVTCLSPSKAVNLAGLQSGSVVVPDERLRRRVVRGLNRDEVAEPNAFAIEATIAAFTRGEPWLDELRTYLDANRRHAEQAITTMPGLRAHRGDATYLLWIDCSALGMDSSTLVAHIRRATGLVLADGKDYDPADSGHLRMNLACPRARLDDGLARLRAALHAPPGAPGSAPASWLRSDDRTAPLHPRTEKAPG